MTVTLICPHCGVSREIRRDRIPPGIRWARCASCRERFEIPGWETPRPSDAARAGEGPGVGTEVEGRSAVKALAPWERRRELGLWASIYLTIKESLFSPERLFGAMSSAEGLREPLAFGLLIGSFGGMVGLFWQFLLIAAGWVSLLPFLPAGVTLGAVFFVLLALIPPFVAVTLFVYAGILNLMLRILKGAKGGFEGTFRVICYSQSAQALALVPFIGGWVGGLWQLIVQVIGLREIHGTSYPRVFLAFLIPLICLLALVIAILIPLVMFFFREISSS
jgi:hypothetical protein